ncbi:hypothetical protein ASE63_08255 [Bosea sp. Root381]|nr:hypothetical protein ASE63_08255 [Bosea sp. Root381]
MSTRSERLAAFMADGVRLPFVWRTRDCCAWPCAWVAAERGISPLVGVSARYRDELSCARLLRGEGGLLALARRVMSAAGLEETGVPVLGDVGLIDTAAGTMGALCLGDKWALKSLEGLAIIPATPLLAWRI